MNDKITDRKQYYAGISIMISNAFQNLPEAEFKVLSKSIKQYLSRHEKTAREGSEASYDGL